MIKGRAEQMLCCQWAFCLGILVLGSIRYCSQRSTMRVAPRRVRVIHDDVRGAAAGPAARRFHDVPEQAGVRGNG
jgi:hypothetical protein